ncbi:hypothetical protein [Stenotrophomonas rhizophila]
MDAELWDCGYKQARSPSDPHELDFLRGLHDQSSLIRLRDWLEKNSGSQVRITSVWQDKYGNVVPDPLAPGQDYNYQEVADLAIIVRNAQNKSASTWMWLLQAKVVENSSSELPPGESTEREIYLYESMPEFTWHGKNSLGFNFHLKKDFPGSAASYRHWSFLCFRENTNPCPSEKFVDVRWPGSLSNVLSVVSFCGELLYLVVNLSRHPAPPDAYGAPLSGNPEWEKLARQILHKANVQPQSGHASKVKGEKANVLACAMLAEQNVGKVIWADRRDHLCFAGCGVCFPGGCSDDIPYSSMSTGFKKYQPDFDLSSTMDEMWNSHGNRSRSSEEDERRVNDRGGPPRNGDQHDGEDGGGGVKLTLFVDLARVEAER